MNNLLEIFKPALIKNSKDPLEIVIDTSSNTIFKNTIDEKLYKYFFEKFDSIAMRRDADRYPTITITINTESGTTTIYALMIADIISNYEGETIAKIQKMAFGGGALISLACKKIKMSPYACMGSIDLQFLNINPSFINKFLPSPSLKYLTPALSKVKEKEFLEPSYLQVFVEYFSSHSLGITSSFDIKLLRILNKRYSKEQIKYILQLFVNKYEGSFPIMRDELPDFLNVENIHLKENNPQIMQTQTPSIPSEEDNYSYGNIEDDTILEDVCEEDNHSEKSFTNLIPVEIEKTPAPTSVSKNNRSGKTSSRFSTRR